MDSNNDGISTEVGNRLEDLFGDSEEQAESFEDRETEAAVSDRLDNLFGDSDEPSGEPDKEAAVAELAKSKAPEAKQPAAVQKPQPDADNSPLKDLKSVVLSLEWEISDQVMQKLGEEIAKLEGIYKDDKILVAFLQLLGSLGKYIQKKRADAHPDSISLLNSVYENLEEVVLSNDLADADKKKLLIGEVNKYKKLKELIAHKNPPRKPVDKSEPVAEEEEIHEPEQETVVETRDSEQTEDIYDDSEVIVQVLREINKTIKSEFKALREELRMLRQKR